jgi:hypothetical protein
LIAGAGPGYASIMSVPLPSRPSHALQAFVEDELLRAPLLFDQLIDGTIGNARKSSATMGPLQRAATADLMQALQKQQRRLAEYFLRSLREQVTAELQSAKAQPHQQPQQQPRQPQALALVDEEEVALDVELSHTIEAIKSAAEHELRELQTYTSALAGDADVARDNNPFRAETYARALLDSAQALPMSRGYQVAFVRQAAPALAQLLRTSYAAATSRLEEQGVEPAAYRTVILPSGSRRGLPGETTFNPDLHRMRDSMPARLETPRSHAPPSRQEPHRAHWDEVAREASNQLDRQSVELVSRLFDAMLSDERVPADVCLVISRLHGPAMRLTLRDDSLLDQNKHPLWRFINRIAYEAEMAPDAADPERVHLLKTAQATVDQLANQPEQSSALYAWAMERLEVVLRKRLSRRRSAAASQVGALQKYEDRIASGMTVAGTVPGALDVAQLDTVPAELVADLRRAPLAPNDSQAWLGHLQPGDWVRMFLQGRWVQAQLLWAGDRQEVWLFGDGASDTTWAVRRGALLFMHEQALLKSLKQRSIVGSAAARVQEQIGSRVAA